ncbi:MAG: DUF4115 domain-containing protein [Geminicoccaceae bacterium]|nr:DUF4115 domain-containing protein [Geminicoccaceae bacterium]
MREVGAQLREVRRERGEDLEEIAEYLRIRSVYLHGIERGDMSVMPGRTYALGFLRTYADYLGFDGEDLIEQIKSTVDDLTGKTRFHIRAPLHESRLPKMPLLVLSFAMLAGIYAGWTWLNRDEGARFDQLPPLPEEVAPLPEEEAAPEPPRVGEQPGEGAGSERSRLQGDPPAAPADEIPPGTSPLPDQAAPSERAGAREEAAPPATTREREDAAGALAEVAPEAGPELAAPSGPAADPAASVPANGGPDAGAGAVVDEEGAGGAGDEVGELIDDLRELPEAASGDQPPGDGGRPAANALDPGSDDTTSPDAPPDAAAAIDSVVEAAEADGTTVHETINADARVILRALGESWMQIRSTSGDYLRTRTLEAGDSFLVPNRDDLVLWTGNAGAIEFLVDGERIAPLGPVGQVIRDVPLEPSALLERAGRPE